MGWLRRAIGWVGVALTGVVAAALITVMLLGTWDVIGTQLFNQPLPGATEAMTSLLVVVVYGALPDVQRRRANIRMELLYANVGPRARAAMDATAHAVALVFFGLLLWQTATDAWWSWQIRQTEVGLIRFPVYPFKAALVVGVACLMLQLLADAAGDLRRLRSGAAT
jgi:TRAP-type C4-dicarboxylate transport system permease small subunit